MSKSSYRILIVEDEILIADMLERYLVQAGHEVVGIAISYEEAIAILEQNPPDFSLLDIRLNGQKSGIDVAHFIRSHEKAHPFIYLTSQTDSTNLNLAKETFPSGYLSKPIQRESLLATLEIVMHRHLAQQEDQNSITLHDGTTKYMVSIEDILFLKAEHIYVQVQVGEDKQILQRSTLKDLADRLPGVQFIQTHRSFIVNLKHVSHWDSQNVYVQGQAIPISRSRRKTIFDRLKGTQIDHSEH